MTDTPQSAPALEPIMLHGLTWKQALEGLKAVDCAARRAHWCSPVVILQGGKPVIDDDGDILPFSFMRGDRSADDWVLVPRCDENGDKVRPSYRTILTEQSK